MAQEVAQQGERGGPKLTDMNTSVTAYKSRKKGGDFVLTTARWTLVVLDERLHLAHEAMGYGSIHRRFTHVPRMFRGTLRFASKVWLRL